MTTLCYTYAGFCLVSCPDPTSKEGKGSGDSWALSWLCKVSRCVTCGECYVIHNDLYSRTESMLLWNPQKRATIWLAQKLDCWHCKTKKTLDCHQALFLLWSLGTRLHLSHNILCEKYRTFFSQNKKVFKSSLVPRLSLSFTQTRER